MKKTLTILVLAATAFAAPPVQANTNLTDETPGLGREPISVDSFNVTVGCRSGRVLSVLVAAKGLGLFDYSISFYRAGRPVQVRRHLSTASQSYVVDVRKAPRKGSYRLVLTDHNANDRTFVQTGRQIGL